jgi:DNA repair protein RecN (Recombination protein N)
VLRQLVIENFAIIDRIELGLAEGLNVLTGETGAGKSILIDAVSSLLGSKLGPEFVRTGAEHAYVEGIFDVPESTPAAVYLAEQELADDEGVAIVSRTLNRSGRSVARVNGRAVPAGVLQELGKRLVDVHGQSEHLSLLRVGEHVDFLDGYAGLKDRRRDLAGLVGTLRALRREIAALQQDEREVARRADLLRFQVDEIAAAQL